jgi:hypothetical protein
MSNKGHTPTPGPVADSPQPEPPPSAKKGFIQIVGDFWQLITALVGIVTVMFAGVTYFATREQLIQLTCMTNTNLNVATYASQVEQLRIQIELADMELDTLFKARKSGLPEYQRKQSDIEGYRTAQKKKIDQYDQEFAKLKERVCESKPAEKKP